MARILIVEDTPDTARMVETLLRVEKHEAVIAASAAAGFIALQQRQFDIVIADQNMPGMTGEVFLERLAVSSPAVGRIMLTADPRIKQDQRPYRVMYKPFRMAELRAEIVRLLAARPAPPR